MSGSLASIELNLVNNKSEREREREREREKEREREIKSCRYHKVS